MKPYRIPGSKLWRVWCEGCGTPMRINAAKLLSQHVCEECEPRLPSPRITGMTPRQAEKYQKINPG